MKTLTVDFVPASYDELFAHYYDYVVKLVISLGIDAENKEDVAMSILLKFLENDVLHDYNPRFTSTYGGATRKAVFRTFLSGFVMTYAQHHRKMQTKRSVREPVSCDKPAGTSGPESSSYATMLDVLAEPVIDDVDSVDTASVIEKIRERLDAEPKRNTQDRSNLRHLFDAMLRHEFTYGTVSPTALSKEFGVSKNSIQAWIKRLRPIVAEVMAADA